MKKILPSILFVFPVLFVLFVSTQTAHARGSIYKYDSAYGKSDYVSPVTQDEWIQAYNRALDEYNDQKDYWEAGGYYEVELVGSGGEEYSDHVKYEFRFAIYYACP